MLSMPWKRVEMGGSEYLITGSASGEGGSSRTVVYGEGVALMLAALQDRRDCKEYEEHRGDGGS